MDCWYEGCSINNVGEASFCAEHAVHEISYHVSIE